MTTPNNTLPPEEYRCMDTGCPEHEQCLRWLDRGAPGGKWLPSCFPYDIPIGDPCPLRIPPKEEDKCTPALGG